VVSEQLQQDSIPEYGDARFSFVFDAPSETGEYTLEAALITPNSAPTRSLRDFKIGPTEPPTVTTPVVATPPQ
jgi:hypothetical protein